MRRAPYNHKFAVVARFYVRAVLHSLYLLNKRKICRLEFAFRGLKTAAACIPVLNIAIFIRGIFQFNQFFRIIACTGRKRADIGKLFKTIAPD